MISKVFLMLLIFSININGVNFFNTKEIFFISLVITGFIFGDYKNIKPLILMLILYFSSFLVNLVLPGSNVDILHGLYFSLGFLYLFLLVFDNKYYRNITIKAYLISSKVVAILIISVWGICFFSNDIKWQLISYLNTIQNDNVAFIFMIRTRKILDWWLPGVYYTTAPCMIPALAYYLAKSINSNYNANKFSCLILAIALILTAARANILAVFVLVFLYFMIINYLRKRVFISLLFFIISSFGTMIVIYFLLNDTHESSLAVKSLHKESYLNLFSTDYFRSIFFGWGAGSSFFTLGFNATTMLTELTLYETVRRYGLISTVLIFTCIWFLPIYKVIIGDLKLYKIYLAAGLLIYTLVAITNPFLLGSIGFCALFFFSSAINMKIEEIV